MAWLAVLVVVFFIILAPVLIWRQTCRNSRLLEDLLDEQEQTNELLLAMAKRLSPPPEKPDFLFTPRPAEPRPSPDTEPVLLADGSEDSAAPDGDEESSHA